MIKAIIFDFDGVILDSAGIKTKAFRKLFNKDHPQSIDAIVDYHVNNMGVSRYTKFRHIYRNILRLPLSMGKERELGEKFSQIAFDEILKAPFISGVLEFLKRNEKKYTLFIISGAPQEELDYIIKMRALSGYFQEVHGVLLSKSEVIRDIMLRQRLNKDETVFIGDADTDLKAAQETGVYFIAMANSDYNQLTDCQYKVKNFHQLDALLVTL